MERRAERTGAAGTNRPVPMKLFAAWEVDRTPSNCIPRLCTLRVTRLRVLGPLGGGEGGAGAGGGGGGGAGGGGAVTLAARMHSSKRTLRSNDIVVPPPQHDVDLDLCFSLQYPHFVKRDGNRLQIMLQRRKKYKNRTILGYKTLAEGVIRMDQVLQRSMDMELELVSVGGGKGGGGGGGGGAAGAAPGAGGAPLARLTITGLASTPVDHDTKNNNLLISAERGYSDEEEEGEFSSVEEADEVTYGAPAAPAARRRQHPHRNIAFNKTDLSYTKLARDRELGFVERDNYIRSKATDRDSDSELESGAGKRKTSRGKLAQRNLKQKFAALLRRFRVPEELAERGATRDPRHANTDIDDLFQELESLSCGEGEDSGPDQMDTISIGSTPKPSLRPFFSSSRSLAVGVDHNSHAAVARHASVASAGDVPLPALPLASAAVSPAAAPAPAPAPRDRRAASAAAALTGEGEARGSSVGEERGSEGNSDADPTADAPPSGASLSSSPPKEKEEKRTRLFRSATSGGNLTPSAVAPAPARKKNSLSISTEARPLSQHDFTQSPTTLEPRRSILEQVVRVLGEEASALPETVALLSAGAGSGAAAALAALAVPTLTAHAAHDARTIMHSNCTSRPLQPRRSILEQVVRVLGEEASALPETVALLSAGAGSGAAAALAALAVPTLTAHAAHDARTIMHALYARINKIGSSSVSGSGGGGGGGGGKARYVRVVVCGGDALVAAVLRAYTELAARRPHDAPAPRFYIVPLGPCCLARQLAATDAGYAALFAGETWSALHERIDPTMQDVADITSRIARYLSSAGGVANVPVGEAMVACRERLGDEDSSQTFVPFLSEVRVGCAETGVSSLELEEGGSPPARPSPPATPAPPGAADVTPPALAALPAPAPPARHQDPLELQLDYWQVGEGGVGDGGKVSVKAGFRALHVARAHNHLLLSTITKEKKQKIMRLGKKKEKGGEGEVGRAQTVEGVSRLICSAKSSHNHPLKVYIDGTEWNGVKFFQLSTQWQTHVKHFPVATSGAPLAPAEP